MEDLGMMDGGKVFSDGGYVEGGDCVGIESDG